MRAAPHTTASVRVAGFERFCNGESDISGASRPIDEEEVANCEEAGIAPIEEFRIGTDGLAVVVNPANDWIENATIEELNQIFTAESWSDVNPDWPSEPIDRYIPGTTAARLTSSLRKSSRKMPSRS